MRSLRAIVLAAAGLCLLSPALPAQDSGAAFDAESFFGGDAAADEHTGDPPLGQTPNPVYQGSYLRPSGLSFTGEASADLVYTIMDPLSATGRSGSYRGVSGLRIDALGGDRNAAKLEASALAGLLYSDTAPEAALSFALKKLYISVHTPRADLSIGRMIINYGRGTAFSPVDLFSTLDDSGLKLGRTGSDALRLLVPLSDFSGLDMVASIAQDLELGVAGLRHYGNALGVDYGLSAFRDGSRGTDGELVLGLDLKGDLELGLSAEALARLPFDGFSLNGAQAVYSFMIGFDYSLGGRWFFDLEGLWNISAGSAEAAGAFSQAAHGFASLSFKPDELNAFDLRAFYASDGSGQALISAARDLAAGAGLAAYAQYASANGSESLTFGARLSVAY